MTSLPSEFAAEAPVDLAVSLAPAAGIDGPPDSTYAPPSPFAQKPSDSSVSSTVIVNES